MPELPEVETIRKTLKQLVLGKTIANTTVHWPKIIQHPDDVAHFRTLVNGQTIQDMKRRGKFLLFYLDDYVLVSHLRMEGKYRVVSQADPIEKHTHVIFHFTDGSDLRYLDVRKFGTMHLFPIGAEHTREPLEKLGPDPFEATYSNNYVVEKLKKTSRMIKTVLLDQTVIAGLGNIYVDEVLFLSEIHPETRAHTLTEAQINEITKNAYKVLKAAVELGGTSIRSYVNGQGEMGMFQQQLNVYAQEGKPCPTCATEIVKIKVSGRGTHLCPRCQTKITA